MTEVLRNGNAPERATEKVTEQDRDPPACRRRQLCPGHGRCRACPRHGASRPTSPRRVTRRDPTAAGQSPGIALQTSSGGRMENHIKSFKRHLAADRTSCHTANANQMRLFLHAGAYWILWTLRAAMPPRSSWRTMQFDTLRLLVVNLVVRVVELKQQVRLHLPACTPDQVIFAPTLAS